MSLDNFSGRSLSLNKTSNYLSVYRVQGIIRHTKRFRMYLLLLKSLKFMVEIYTYKRKLQSEWVIQILRAGGKQKKESLLVARIIREIQGQKIFSHF